jgi:cellulose synthase/poly-beta-1,6-N-acetylglucosamine synthase-like glycosyltransferase
MTAFMAACLVNLQWVFFAYFILLSVAYLVLHYVSVIAIIRYMRDNRAEYLLRILPAYQPPITILIPAFNEEQSIVSSIHSVLQLDYPEFEVVVINDGSSDATLARIVAEFSMLEFPEAYRQRIATQRIRAVYASPRFPRLRLVDKDNGGKSDALNAGINCTRYPLFCAIDADCILSLGSLGRVVRPFLDDSTTVATGGVVRVLNGCTVKNGSLEKVGLPRAILPLFQSVEYLRAFLFGRMGWSPINALLVISGAFGVFYKEHVVAVGGYRTDTVGEDMDLVVRLHRKMRRLRRPYRITFVPDPICWSEVPSDLKSLMSQRTRWKRGLAESLVPNMRLLFSRHAGAVGLLAFPFMILFELLGPIIEALGYVAMIALWLLHLIPLQSFLVFLFLSVGMGVLLSTNAIFLERLSFQLYPRVGQQLTLFAAAVLENFGYRQLTALFRLMGLMRWVFSGKAGSDWGRIVRNGSWQKSAADEDGDQDTHTSSAVEAHSAAHAPQPGLSRPDAKRAARSLASVEETR